MTLIACAMMSTVTQAADCGTLMYLLVVQVMVLTKLQASKKALKVSLSKPTVSFSFRMTDHSSRILRPSSLRQL